MRGKSGGGHHTNTERKLKTSGERRQRKDKGQRDRNWQRETKIAGGRHGEEGKLKTGIQNKGKNFTERKPHLKSFTKFTGS